MELKALKDIRYLILDFSYFQMKGLEEGEDDMVSKSLS